MSEKRWCAYYDKDEPREAVYKRLQEKVNEYTVPTEKQARLSIIIEVKEGAIEFVDIRKES